MNLHFKADESLYKIKALLEVMQDGLSNDVVGINQDYYATTLRLAVDMVEELQADVDAEFAQRRKEMKIAEYTEDDTDGKDSLLGEGSIFGDESYSPIRNAVQNSEPEDSEEGEESNDRFATGSFGVTMVEEHPDGSATFEVHGSKEQMQKLFSAFFADALTRGIDSAEGFTSRWVAEKQVITAAHNLEDWLRRWEAEDELDYDPEVKVYRHELTEALNKWRGAVSQAKVW